MLYLRASSQLKCQHKSIDTKSFSYTDDVLFDQHFPTWILSIRISKTWSVRYCNKVPLPINLPDCAPFSDSVGDRLFIQQIKVN